MERDVRIAAVNSIMQTPHRKVEPLIPIHKEAEASDPLFYIKFALWYNEHGTIRDHQKLFASKVITSEFTEFRAIGQELLGKMSPRDAKTTVGICFDNFGGKLGGKRRRLRKAVSKMIGRIERASAKDDGRRILINSKALKSLYKMLHIAPGSDAIAKSLKFRAPASTKMLPAFQIVQDIRAAGSDEAAVCELIHNNKVPLLVAVSIVQEVTPAIAAALVAGLSYQEVVNSMAMFERRGLLDNAEFKKLIESKLKKTKKKNKSASMRSSKGAKALKKHSEILETATDDFVASLPTVKQNILVAIDKSYSMQKAINLGKEVATILAAKVENPDENLHVCVFDDTVRKMNVGSSSTFTDFEAQFRYIRANGTTSLGAVVEYCGDNDLHPDIVLFITDAEETQVPFLDSALQKSTTLVGARLINCKVGAKTFDLDVKTSTKRDKNLEIENVTYDGDYYSLPNLVKMMSAGGIRGLIKEIDSIDLSKYLEV